MLDIGGLNDISYDLPHPSSWVALRCGVGRWRDMEMPKQAAPGQRETIEL